VNNPLDALRANAVYDEFLAEKAANMPADLVDLFALWRAARCREPYPTPWWREHAPRDEEDAPEDGPARRRPGEASTPFVGIPPLCQPSRSVSLGDVMPTQWESEPCTSGPRS
jgi:hypothetical protein